MNQQQPNSFRTGPDERGRFGDFGGRFVSETLMPLILALEAEYGKAKTTPSFWAEMDDLWKHYVGRPSPLYLAERLTERLGGAKVFFKRDELNHTGAHKINNVLGQSFSPAAWARPASSPRPAPASTASRPPRCARASG